MFGDGLGGGGGGSGGGGSGASKVQMFPPLTTAASLVPSLEDAMLCHCSILRPKEVSSVQVAPESVEVKMFPPEFWFKATAASLVPSLENAMLCHCLDVGETSRSR